GKDCPDIAKHPFHDLGGLSSASCDPEQLRTIFGSTKASVGLLCESFWVLDCDGEKGIEDLKQLVAKNGELPRTPTSETGGGGRHYFFKADRRIAKNTTRVQGRSIDIRTKGGVVVAPPSLHSSGHRYRWIESPDDVDLAKAPEWLIEFVLNKPTTTTGSFVFEDRDLATTPGATEGSRNEQLCRLVGSHLGRLGDTPDLLQLATDWGRRCSPPMKDSAIAKTVANLVAKHLSNNNPQQAEADELIADLDLDVRSFGTIEAK
ncbi:MAG: bifunctional DNA primase/polymerase, partial [Pirellulaceae bacterium]